MTDSHVHFSNPTVQDNGSQDDQKKHDSTAWSFCNEVPLYIPITPRLDGIASPRLEGRLSPRLDGSLSDALLCTPSLKTTDTAKTDGEELFVDPRLREIHKLSMEQRDELNRVTAKFGQRFAALCYPNHAFMVPLHSKHISAERDSAVHPGEQSSADLTRNPWRSPVSRELQDTVDDRELPDRTVDDSDSDNEPDRHQPGKNLDQQLVRAWLEDQSHEHKLSHAASHYLSSMSTDQTPFQKVLINIVQSRAFEVLSTSVIVCHAVVMGILADHNIRNMRGNMLGSGHSSFFDISDTLFLCCYLVELLLRIGAERCSFLLSAWNHLDLVLVALDALHKVLEAILDSGGGSHQLATAATARTFRVLRLLRVMRVIRAVRFFRELRMMIKCIGAGLKVVIWVWLILFIFIYIFAVFLLQQVSADIPKLDSIDIEMQKALRFRFGNLITACFTLFMSITGGISWVECTDPLTALDWSNGAAFVGFIGLTMFVMLNIVSGIFVDCAMSAARADEEELMHDIIHNEDAHLHKIRTLFEMANEDDDKVLSLPEFDRQMASNSDLRIWFKSLGIGVHEVRSLFRLLDADHSGMVSVEEFIAGCMQLKEGPSAIDLATLVLETKQISDKLREIDRETARQFKSLHKRMSKITRS